MITVALTVVLALQSLRALFPLLFAFGEDVDYQLAALIAILSFAAPLLAWPVGWLLPARAAAPLALTVLVGLRLALQFTHPIPLWLAIAAAMVALVTLTLLLMSLRKRRENASHRFVLGLLLGFAMDTALRGVFLTWDLPWQESAAAIAVTFLFALSALISGWFLSGAAAEVIPERDWSVWSTASVGPFLFLELLFLQSPAFVAAGTGYSLEGAMVVLLVADALGMLAVSWTARRTVPPVTGGVAGVALAVGVYALTQVRSTLIALLIVAAQAIAAGLLAWALAPRVGGRRAGRWRTPVGMAVGGVALGVLAAGYQIHYEVPLPFANTFLPPAAAVLLALATIRHREETAARGPSVALAPVAVALALLLVPIGLVLSRPERPVVPAAGRPVRIVNYNVHLGVNPDGQVDPEATARTIEALEPDVVMLQEAGRGWPINTTMDVAEWLSRRLGMPFVYQPAADTMFGNAIMTNLPIPAHDGGFLPFGEGPQRRSYLRAEIEVNGEGTMTVIDVHLQHQPERIQTREDQIQRLLQVWGGSDRTVIGGDMNTQPNEANLRLFLDAGLVSVQDAAGLGHLPTATEPSVLGDRVDYVFVTSDLSFADVAVPFSGASDHLPIAVTILNA
jgi:endonuclease/exonuclease/phosphatase family metal-dependent hydrolase